MNQEGINIIIKAQDQYSATLNKIKASNDLFGQSVESIKKQINSLQKYMVSLVTAGVDPASKGIVRLQNQLKGLNQELLLLQSTTNTTTNVLNNSTNSVKNSSRQWTNLALVIQDLPYGFRGIQNNLPALLGGFAAVTGPVYFAFSAIIAAITAVDAGIIKLGNSVKLTSNFSKDASTTFANETVKLESLYTVSTNVNTSMEERLQAAKTLKSEYPGLLSLYSEEQITLGEADTAYRLLTDTLWQYAQAKAAEKTLEELAIKQIDLNIKKTKAQTDQKERQTNAFREVKALLWDEMTFTQRLNKTLLDLPKGPLMMVNALNAVNKSSEILYGIDQEQQKINDEVAIYKGIINENINAEERLKKFKEDEYAREQARLKKLQEAADRKNKKILENAKKEAAKLDAFAAKRQAQAGGDIEVIKEPALDPNAQAKAFKDKMAFDKRMSKERVDLLKQQYSLEVSEAQGSFEKIKLAEETMRNALNQGFMDGTIKLDEYLTAIQELRKTSNKTVADEAKAAMQETLKIGIGIMNALGPALDLLLEKGANIGEVISRAFNDIIKKLAKVAIAAAITVAIMSLIPGLIAPGKGLATFGNLITSGMGLGSNLFGGGGTTESEPKKLASGGIISGPTYGLMGEYPGAANNPEVVAPLDKLKDMIGVGNGTLEARISGNDLVILMNKASRNNNNTF